MAAMGATGRVYLHVRTAHFRRAKMVTSMLRIYLPIINNFFKKTVVLGHIHKVLQIKEMTFLSVCVWGAARTGRGIGNSEKKKYK